MTASTDLAPGFRMTEIGPLPEEWGIAPFDEAIERKRVKVGKLPRSEYRASGRFAIVDQGQQFVAGYTDDANLVYCGDLPVIVFGDHTRALKLVSFPFVCGADGTKVLVPNREKYAPAFLYYALRTLDIPSRGYNRHYPLLRQRALPLPPLPEQRKIAAVLDTVRRAIEATEKVIAAARELKRSFLQYLFTYGPVPYDQADRVPLKETEIGPMPEGWRVLTLGSVARTATGGTPSRARPEYYGGSVPWVKSGELGDAPVTRTSEYLAEEGLQNSSAKLVPAGTLLVAMYGATAGKVGILRMRAATNQAVCAVYPRADMAVATYLFHALMHRREDLMSRRYGGAQPNLGQTVLRMFDLPIPSDLADQRLVAHMLDAVVTKASAEQARRSALQSLFVGLLHDLMTGRIRVNDLDLPAGVQP